LGVVIMSKAQIIQSATEYLPENWAYTPVKGKAPTLGKWQTRPFGKADVIQEIKTPRWTGIGALCGVPSGGLLFLDHDGESCDSLIEKLSGQSRANALPATVSLTSGRPGRYQSVYNVPAEFWNAIRTIKKSTGVKGADGKLEQLEFRWTGCQSVVCGIHPETQQPYRWINSPVNTPIADAPQWMIEQMLTEKAEPNHTAEGTNMDAIPVLTCLARKHRDLIERGESNGNRNNSGAALARDLIGTDAALRDRGLQVEGDARQLFDDFCARCNPPIVTKEADTIWKSAVKGNPSPCLSPDALGNCIKFANKLDTSGQVFGKVVSLRDGVPTAPLDSLSEKIAALLDRNIAGASLEAEKIKLRQQFALDGRDFERMWEKTSSEYEDADVADRSTVGRLLASKRASIALESVLPKQIAPMLSKMAEGQNLRPELYLMSMLAAVGSLAKNGTDVTLVHSEGFSVTPNIFVAIVAPASQRKSPVLSRVVGKPFWKLTEAAKKRYNSKMAAWEDAKKAAQRDDQLFTDPEPQQELYFFTKATGESILSQANRVPERGLLSLSDELSGYFKSGNQYRGGRGSDMEDLLSYYDGAGGLTLRVDGERNSVQTINFGLLGAIQPTVLKFFLLSCEDANGGWARWFFVVQPLSAMKFPEVDEKPVDDLTEIFAEYYTRIADAPVQNYTLTSEAYEVFRDAADELEQRRVNEPNPAVGTAIGKMAGRIGKIALNLHLVECAVAGQFEGRTEIDKSTIQNAIAITEMGLAQLQSIYCDASDDDGLSPIFASVIELSHRKGAITSRDVSRLFSGANKISAVQARDLLVKLESQGYGDLSGSGKAIEFTAYPERSEVKLGAVEPEPVAEVEEWGDVWLDSRSYVAPHGIDRGHGLVVVQTYDVQNPDTGQTEQAVKCYDMNSEQSYNIWLKHLSNTPVDVDDNLGTWEPDLGWKDARQGVPA
jgi:Protein of unknown function (DUF3987)/Bifunctional DNA primase/polymerase, N-terminal